MEHKHTHPDKPWQAIRTEAIESILNEINVLSSEDVDKVVKHYEENVGPKTGARIIAHAWADSEFKNRLLTNGLDACAELGIGGPETELLHVLENTPTVHNVVVCTLCSCYPWPILGLPPTWYKSSAYRSRLVREPRKLLSEFGVPLSNDTEIRVWDSVSEIRYLVMPQQPANIENLNEDQLASLISRNHMIGVARDVQLHN